MKTVKFDVVCTAMYTSSLDIPDAIAEDEEKVLKYIRTHLDECSVNDLDWIEDLDPEEAVTMEDIRFIY